LLVRISTVRVVGAAARAKKVMRGAVVPHPLAPTIDHVVPLAAGGLHEPANVQLAHFLCNARKSDRGEAD